MVWVRAWFMHAKPAKPWATLITVRTAGVCLLRPLEVVSIEVLGVQPGPAGSAPTSFWILPHEPSRVLAFHLTKIQS